MKGRPPKQPETKKHRVNCTIDDEMFLNILNLHIEEMKDLIERTEKINHDMEQITNKKSKYSFGIIEFIGVLITFTILFNIIKNYHI